MWSSTRGSCSWNTARGGISRGIPGAGPPVVVVWVLLFAIFAIELSYA